MYYEIDEDGSYIVIGYIWNKIMQQYHSHKICGILSEKEEFFPTYEFIVRYPEVLQPRMLYSDNIRIYEMAEWCEKNLNDKWAVGIVKSGFQDETDAMAFKLKWT